MQKPGQPTDAQLQTNSGRRVDHAAAHGLPCTAHSECGFAPAGQPAICLVMECVVHEVRRVHVAGEPVGSGAVGHTARQSGCRLSHKACAPVTAHRPGTVGTSQVPCHGECISVVCRDAGLPPVCCGCAARIHGLNRMLCTRHRRLAAMPTAQAATHLFSMYRGLYCLWVRVVMSQGSLYAPLLMLARSWRYMAMPS